MTDRIDVPVRGGSLAAYRLGDHRTQATPVLAIHGITSTSRAWLEVARTLGDSAALVAVDLRGRGRSNDLPPPFGIDAHVEDMLAVLDHLGVERAVIAGHSLGAYLAAALAVGHPSRVRSLVLVDGGLTLPGSELVDPEPFMEDFLGPTFARLKLEFDDPERYREWWFEHPAFAHSDVDRELLAQYADHDLVGEAPRLRSSVNPESVRVDGLGLFRVLNASSIEVPAVLLCAPRGMVDDPSPMQPLEVVQEWASRDPSRRRAVAVPDVNHYTILFGPGGARAVAAEIAAAVSG